MGDLSEIRGLITVTSFMSAFLFLTLLIPSAFNIGGYEQQRQINVPEYFEAIDIQSFAETYNITTGNDFAEVYFSIGGWNLLWEVKPSQECYVFFSFDSWWIFKWNFQSFHWYNKNGIEKSTLLNLQPPGHYGNHYVIEWKNINGNQTIQFSTQNPNVQLIVFFGYNTTEFSNVQDAINNDALSVLFCINFDQVNTSFNAWNLIGMLLFFQMPNVHPTINMLIAIPLWVVIAYLIYVLILKALPFVGD